MGVGARNNRCGLEPRHENNCLRHSRLFTYGRFSGNRRSERSHDRSPNVGHGTNAMGSDLCGAYLAYSTAAGVPPMTALEKFLDGITPSYVSGRAKELDEDMKVPFAQTMSVFLFSRLFTKHLDSCAQEFPEPLKTNWEFPHDRIFTEVVSFYFFVLLREYFEKRQIEYDENGRDDHGDGEEDGRLKDPYTSSLVKAISLASVLIHRYADFGPPKEFVRNRAFSYSLPTNKDNPVDLLERLIFKSWNPDKSGNTRLGISEPFLPIMTTIAAMPIEAVQKSCKGLYEDLARGPNTRVSPKTKTKRLYPDFPTGKSR